MTGSDGNSETAPVRRPGPHASGQENVQALLEIEIEIDWATVPARVAELADEPELLTLIQATVEGASPTELTGVVYTALVEAIAQSVRPGLVGECLSLLLGSRPALEHIGDQLYGICVGRARPPAGEVGPKAWLLAADALEAATRLALGGWASRYGVLAELVKAPVPAPPGYARAALRCLSASFEQYRDPDLLDVLERFAGLAPGADVAGPAADWAWEVTPDATYELGCASLLQALGEEDLAAVEKHLSTAAARLQVAAADREDAALVGAVVTVLASNLPTEAGRAAYAATDFDALAAALERGVTEHVLESRGLDHWRAPRLDAEVAWSHLIRDVASTRSAMTEASWYQAETTLADVLAAWTASRCSRVLRRQDHVAVRAILGPNIVSGIAVKAALMKHLDDHIAALEAAGPATEPGGGATSGSAACGSAIQDTEDSQRAQLEAARALLAQARTRRTGGVDRPKPVGSAAATSSEGDASALPLLTGLLGGSGKDPDVRGALATLSPEVARQLEDALSVRATGGTGPAGAGVGGDSHYPFTPDDNLVVVETFRRLKRQLSGSRWYSGEVAEAVDQLLVHLLRFWRSRDGIGPSRMPYLFTADAKEEDLARDLKTFFDGSAMAALLHTEVRDVGGGRVDVMCSFPRFRLVIELKKDDRQVEMAARGRYLAQTAGYQSADVPLGFLAVLDLRPWPGPTPHLASCFGVEVLDDEALGEPRYVITMAVPGNRTIPSSMR